MPPPAFCSLFAAPRLVVGGACVGEAAHGFAAGSEAGRSAAGSEAATSLADGPCSRLEHEPLPQYGDDDPMFSVQIWHGGFFIGQGRTKKYYGGNNIWFDNIDKNTWSPQHVDDLIEQIGYEKEGRITVYYCMPGLQVSTNGLRVINRDDDTDNMRTFVTFGHHFIDIFLEHDDSIRDLDDVVRFPIRELPQVFSPMKPLIVDTSESGEGFRTASEVLKDKGKSAMNRDVDEVGDIDESGDSESQEEDGFHHILILQVSSFHEVYGDTMLQQMRMEHQSRRPAFSHEHMPESNFINSARAQNTSIPHVTTTANRDGSQAMKLRQMKMEKDREMVEKRDVRLEALSAAKRRESRGTREERSG
ncbi:hypothetical protein ZWY2020_040317 [Hordeum vulgare]|nr:hypothetical protein ZWY2020_040317 [Hordeum vulgare]